MKKAQKFKRGNLIRIAKDLGPLMTHFESDKEAIIIGSYADQFGGSNRDSYTIMFLDGNECSWYYEKQLTLINEGGEHLILEALKRREVISNANKDINLIIKDWEKNKSALSGESILLLFDKIGYKSSFLGNGEFYILYNDWSRMYPFIDMLIKSKTFEEVTSQLTNKLSDTALEKLTSFWNEIKTIQAKLHEDAKKT